MAIRATKSIMGIPYNNEVEHMRDLVYGSKALIPIEIEEWSLRFNYATEEENNEVVATNLDLLEGQREMVLIRAAQK